MQLKLLLALLCAGPDAGPAAAATEAGRNAVLMLKDVPGLTSPPLAPSSTTVDGIEVTQSSCVSKASVAELKAHFAQAFQKAGLYFAPEAQGFQPQKGEQLTGLDTENLVSYTAFLQPSAGKLVTVVLALSQVGLRKLDKNTAPIAPVFPGAEDVTAYRLEALQAMSYAVKATPAQLKAFYREALGKAGWVEREGLLFVKGSQQLTLTVSPGVSEQYVMIQVQAAAP